MPEQQDLSQMHDSVNGLLHDALQLALNLLPCISVGDGACESGLQRKPRRYYLRRTLNKKFKLHVERANLCRHLIKNLLSCKQSNVAYMDFMQGQAVLETTVRFTELSSMATWADYNQMRAAVDAHRIQAKQAANDIARDVRRQATDRKRQCWQHLWRVNKARAHVQVFEAEHDQKGATQSQLPAVNHPIAGSSAEPEVARSGLHFYHALLGSPKVPLPTSFPWEDQALDTFDLLSKGAGKSLQSQITEELYFSCLKSLSNRKATGPDCIPNELLKHLPMPMHMMLLHFFQLSYQQASTPVAWKRSITKLFHKKDPCDGRDSGL